MKFSAARSWNKIQWLDLKIGYQDSSRRKWPANWHGLLNCERLSVALHFFRNENMYLHISSSLSSSNHPWISQNENCTLVNSSLPLIRAFWDPLISPFWSPQHKYGFPSKHLTSLVTEYLLSHPSILGVTLCFCTGSYAAAAAAAGRRFLFTR